MKHETPNSKKLLYAITFEIIFDLYIDFSLKYFNHFDTLTTS